MTDNTDTCNRTELRLCKEMAIFVETLASSGGEDRSPGIVISKTIDVSANGLQVIMDRPVETGSILQVCVEFLGEPPHYHLTGEVKWVASGAGGQEYLVGFQLLESDQTDIEAWKRRIALTLDDPDVPVR